MAYARIAVLFDAENINCDAARRVLSALAPRGTVQIKKAVGDFSAASLATWIGCGRDNGIELVLQPSLGKGKNGSDIKLTIEAMDMVHEGHIDAFALVTRDRDFTPLALRLRDAGLQVLGFAQFAPNPAFAAACTSFELIAQAEASPLPAMAEKVIPSPKASTKPQPPLATKHLERLRRVVAVTCQNGPVRAAALRSAIAVAEPKLLPLLGGKGKFQKSLRAHGLIEVIGSGNEQRLRPIAGLLAA